MVSEAQAVEWEKVFMRASLSLEELKMQLRPQQQLVDGLGIPSLDYVKALLKGGKAASTNLMMLRSLPRLRSSSAKCRVMCKRPRSWRLQWMIILRVSSTL